MSYKQLTAKNKQHRNREMHVPTVLERLQRGLRGRVLVCVHVLHVLGVGLCGVNTVLCVPLE